MTIHKRDHCSFLSQSLIVTALLLSTTLIAACTSETEETNPNADSNVTTEEVTEQTEKVEGQSVTVRSEVRKKVDETSFMLDNDGEDILVINTSGEPFALPTDDDTAIQVTGKVQDLVLVDIERDYDLDLDPEVYAEYEKKPALLANSLALAPEPGEITENPEKFYDLAIAVEGEVEEVLDSTSFTLDEEQLFGATDLLVINTPVTEALDGEKVTVTGKLRKFVLAEFEQDYDLTWDLDVKNKIEAEYTDKPVFVADSLYPTAQ